MEGCSFPPPPERIDYVERDAEEALRRIAEVEKRLEFVEYICRKLIEVRPDLAETSCAGCKYLGYARQIGLGAADGLVTICGKVGNWEFRPFKETDGEGCYKWERRKEY